MDEIKNNNEKKKVYDSKYIIYSVDNVNITNAFLQFTKSKRIYERNRCVYCKTSHTTLATGKMILRTYNSFYNYYLLLFYLLRLLC